jgi:hypothetical protein
MIGRTHGRPGRPATVSQPQDNPEDAYRLLLIEPTKAPEGSSGSDWFTYRISQGENMIRGYKRGSRATVTADVEQIVVSLNERRHVRRGRVDLTPSAKPVAAPTVPTSPIEPAETPGSDAGGDS